MIYGVKLQKLLEQEMESGRGTQGYRGKIRSLLGLSENVDTGEPTMDRAAQGLNAKDFSLQEVAHTFLGPDYRSKVAYALALGPQLRLQEAEGGVVLPSHFAHISAFSDTVGGLLDAMILAAYTNPMFIGDDMMEIIPARVQGGKIIGVRNDGNVSDNLPDGDPYPTVGLGETYVSIPENERYGVTVQLNMKTFIYDRTDQIQSAADAAGYSVRRKKETRQADVVLGKVNTYARDGVGSNTYRTAVLATAAYNGTTPMSYVNAIASTPLNDWQDLNTGIQILGANTDPATGFEIAIDPKNATLWVAPHNELLTRTILSATNVQTRAGSAVNTGILTQASAVQLNIRNSGNPLSEYATKLVASRIWYNRLLLAGVDCTKEGASGHTGALDATQALDDDATHARSVWLYGDFKRAFVYRQIVPFSTVQAPLSSEDTRRDIVAVYVSSEHGVPFIREPRYVFQGVNTYT